MEAKKHRGCKLPRGEKGTGLHKGATAGGGRGVTKGITRPREKSLDLRANYTTGRIRRKVLSKKNPVRCRGGISQPGSYEVHTSNGPSSSLKPKGNTCRGPKTEEHTLEKKKQTKGRKTVGREQNEHIPTTPRYYNRKKGTGHERISLRRCAHEEQKSRKTQLAS